MLQKPTTSPPLIEVLGELMAMPLLISFQLAGVGPVKVNDAPLPRARGDSAEYVAPCFYRAHRPWGKGRKGYAGLLIPRDPTTKAGRGNTGRKGVNKRLQGVCRNRFIVATTKR